MAPDFPDTLRQKVQDAPKCPGCYLFYDARGSIIYIGKSKLLRNRVRQYLTEAAATDERTRHLVREIHDVAFRVTRTDLDALMLEYRLIKQHRPWFNAQHKRDVRYPFLRIDTRATFAPITIAEARKKDGARYFGAFADAFDAQDAIDLLGDIWGTPRCGRESFPTGGRGCVYLGMRQCMGPCCGEANATDYQAAIAEIIQLLSGKPTHAMAYLEETMRAQAAEMAFERAARTKTLMAKLERLERKCARRFRIHPETNALLLMRGHGEAAWSAFAIREGSVTGRIDYEDAGADIDSIMPLLTCTTPLEDATWMPACLEDIHADKLFVPLPKRSNQQRLRQLLQQSVSLFFNQK